MTPVNLFNISPEIGRGISRRGGSKIAQSGQTCASQPLAERPKFTRVWQTFVAIKLFNMSPKSDQVPQAVGAQTRKFARAGPYPIRRKATKIYPDNEAHCISNASTPSKKK